MNFLRQFIPNFFFELLEIIGLILEHIVITLGLVLSGKINMREFIVHLYEVSWQSVSTVALTNVSIGMVSSLQLTEHFQTFGALSEIGGANAMALMRELAPVITAVVVSGRVGSAWAAEIGTMKITEQINALKIMRLNPEEFLIAPRIFGCMLAMPVLNVVAILASLGGAYFVAEAISQLGIIAFTDSIKRYVDVYDFMASNIKAVFFGGIIASIACSYGLKAGGGAAGVGKYTTKAVVTCLICLFALNYVMSFVFYAILNAD
jgi:phospholipid/cholesterol/gamma-HCH transport system permease protein